MLLFLHFPGLDSVFLHFSGAQEEMVSARGGLELNKGALERTLAAVNALL